MPNNPLYKKPEFITELIRLVKIYSNYNYVAKELNNKFKTSISDVHVKNLYFDNTAEALVKTGKSKKFYEDSYKHMEERWKASEEIVGWIIDAARKAKKQIDEAGNSKSAFVFLKLVPTLVTITKEIREQLNFIQKQQEQIKSVQQNLIYSPTQINNIMFKNFPKLAEEGYIKILKPIPGMEDSKEISSKKDSKELKGGKK